MRPVDPDRLDGLPDEQGLLGAPLHRLGRILLVLKRHIAIAAWLSSEERQQGTQVQRAGWRNGPVPAVPAHALSMQVHAGRSVHNRVSGWELGRRGTCGKGQIGRNAQRALLQASGSSKKSRPMHEALHCIRDAIGFCIRIRDTEAGWQMDKASQGRQRHQESMKHPHHKLAS